MKKEVLKILLIAIGIYTFYTQNIHAGTEPKTIWVEEAYWYMQRNQNITILDVRTEEEFEEDGSLYHAKLIPLAILAHNLDKLDKSKTIIVYCYSGRRSGKAATLLSEHGFTVLNLSGGISAWIDMDFPYNF